MNECSTLEITTTIGCSLMCIVCPQDKLLNTYKSRPKYLTYSNFVEILDKIPKNVRIDFSGMSESWLNKECTKMLTYTLKSEFNVAIYSTLYGMEIHDVDSIFELFHLLKEAAADLVLTKINPLFPESQLAKDCWQLYAKPANIVILNA